VPDAPRGDAGTPSAILQSIPGGGGTPISVPLQDDSFGFDQSVVLGSRSAGGAVGKAKFETLSVDAAPSDASPALLSALFRGQGFATAVLTQDDAAGRPVAEWTLGGVYVSHQGLAGQGGPVLRCLSPAVEPGEGPSRLHLKRQVVRSR